MCLKVFAHTNASICNRKYNHNIRRCISLSHFCGERDCPTIFGILNCVTENIDQHFTNTNFIHKNIRYCHLGSVHFKFQFPIGNEPLRNVYHLIEHGRKICASRIGGHFPAFNTADFQNIID